MVFKLDSLAHTFNWSDWYETLW